MVVKVDSPRLVVFLFALLALSCSNLAYAKTWYIERWGEDISGPPSCGKKTSPCLTIQFVLDNLAKRNDRLVVGPGKYVENILIDTGAFGLLEGIKLESTVGRHGTIIQATPSADAVVDIRRPRVQIGRKGKGFTIKGDSNSSLYGILARWNTLTRTKIEGNKVMGNTVGILGRGEKVQIRGNLIIDNIRGISTIGIQCISCNNPLIQDNEVSGNNGSSGRGFGIVVSQSTKASVQRNRVSHQTTAGIYSYSSDFGNYRDNVVGDSLNPIQIDDIAGTQVQGNIVSGGASSGIYLQQSTFPSSQARVRSNLAVDSNHGIYLRSLNGGKIERNTTVDSDVAGFFLDAFTSAPGFSNNNTMQSISTCGIHNNSGLALEFKRHYFDANDVICDVAGSSSAIVTPATRPSTLRVNRAKVL